MFYIAFLLFGLIAGFLAGKREDIYKRFSTFLDKWPDPGQKPRLSPGLGPYRLGDKYLPEEDDDDDQNYDDEGESPAKPANKPDPDGCMTAAEARALFEKKEAESVANVSKLWKELVQPKIDDALEKLERQTYVFRLTKHQIKVLSEHGRTRLKFKIESDDDSLNIEW